jgi:hypothetical protein
MQTASDQIKVPKSQAAALRYLLECVENGYYHHTRGRIPVHKAAAFAQKMADTYPILGTRGARSYAREKGRANVRLVIFPAQDNPADFHYYILATDGTGDVHEMEQLRDARTPTGKVQLWKEYKTGFAPQYELVGRPVKSKGGATHRWTWVMADSLVGTIAEWLKTAAGRARSSEAKNPASLFTAIDAIRHMPGFGGIRLQKRELVRAVDVPKALAAELRLGDLGGYVDKSLPVFSDEYTLTAVLAGAKPNTPHVNVDVPDRSGHTVETA